MASEMAAIAAQLVAPGKGLLAADESNRTIEKRFRSVGVESTEATRRDYRELLFTAPGMEQYISGVILFDETIRQATADGVPFPELLAAKGCCPASRWTRGWWTCRSSPGSGSPRAWTGWRSGSRIIASGGALRQVAGGDRC